MTMFKNRLRRWIYLPVILVSSVIVYVVYFKVPPLKPDEDVLRFVQTLDCVAQRDVWSKNSINKADVDLRIIVMTYNRAESLLRLLTSLNEAEYYGDRVHVDVFIDKPKGPSDIDARTYVTASSFSFEHGSLEVHNHTSHQGIYGQWMCNWKVTDQTSEMAVLFEDDITVSRYFYKWLKQVHKRYDHLSYVNGYSLQGKSMKFGGDPGDLKGPETQAVFALPVLGCWGFSPNKRNWLHFLQWLRSVSVSEDPSFRPLVPGLLPSKWFQSLLQQGHGNTMWEMWHIYHAHKFNELTVYVSLPNSAGLTINWEEPGLHYEAKWWRWWWSKPPLLEQWEEKYESLPDKPVELDANGNVVKEAVLEMR